MINSISNADFMNKKPLYVEHIESGFSMYPSVILSGSKAEMKQFIRHLLNENQNSSYADFHYAKLNEKQKEDFKAGLEQKERECFALFEVNKGKIFYPLSPVNLDFLADITAREWLFSSFYFVTHKVTVWGNYKMKYPVFAKDRDTLDWCVEIAGKYNLFIENYS